MYNYNACEAFFKLLFLYDADLLIFPDWSGRKLNSVNFTFIVIPRKRLRSVLIYCTIYKYISLIILRLSWLRFKFTLYTFSHTPVVALVADQHIRRSYAGAQQFVRIQY